MGRGHGGAARAEQQALEQGRGLGTGSRATLAAYCAAYALWAEAIQAIQKYGAMVKSPSGFPMQSPYVAIANRQAEIMMRIASEFGFTPASRSRISKLLQPEPSLLDYIHNREDDEVK
jgi:P27 family predicted phage terminase small subunit